MLEHVSQSNDKSEVAHIRKKRRPLTDPSLVPLFTVATHFAQNILFFDLLFRSRLVAGEVIRLLLLLDMELKFSCLSVQKSLLHLLDSLNPIQLDTLVVVEWLASAFGAPHSTHQGDEKSNSKRVATSLLTYAHILSFNSSNSQMGG